MQEAAKGLLDKLGDPSALVLIGSPEQGKVAIVVSLSEGAVKKVRQSEHRAAATWRNEHGKENEMHLMGLS